MKKLAKMERPDVFHVHHEMMVSMAGIRIAKRMGIPIVQTMHGREDAAVQTTVPQPFAYWFSCFAVWWHSATIRHDVLVTRDDALAKTRTARHMWGLMVNHANYADAVVVPSKHFADKLKHYGMHKPTFIVSNGVEDASVDRKWEVRKWDGKKPLQVLWSSRMSRAKRPVEFLKAIAKTDFPIHVSMFGDGEMEALSKSIVRIKGIEDKVTFYGPVKPERIKREMSKHHILILASYNFDNQPMTMLEALATGMPVIYCDPDMSEIVPAAGALLTSSPEVDGMAAGFEKLAADPGMIEKMSAVMLKHRKDALQSTQIAKLVKVYEEVIKGKKKAQK